MTDADRIRLLGRYKTPRFRYGDAVFCEVRGDVVITGLSNGRIGRTGTAFQQEADNLLLLAACLVRAAPARPLGWTARCSGVDPALLGFRGSAPPSNSARTAASDRARTARCRGATPVLSTALGSAPIEMRYSITPACARGSRRPPSTA